MILGAVKRSQEQNASPSPLQRSQLSKSANPHMTAAKQTSDDVWRKSFSSEQQVHQLEEDKEAWHGIIGILLAIVTFGVTLAALVVWCISAWAELRITSWGDAVFAGQMGDPCGAAVDVGAAWP